MGTYDSIQVPIQGQPISSSLFGVRTRDAIVDIDRRLSIVESTIANYAYKTAVTTRASTVTPVDDPDLRLFLDANSTYFVEFFVSCAALDAADIKTAWSVPAGVTSTTRRVLGPGSLALDTGADNIASRWGVHVYATAVNYNGVRNNIGLQWQFQEIAVVRTGATAGYVSLQWSQVTSNATGSTVNNDSFCRATKIA